MCLSLHQKHIFDFANMFCSIILFFNALNFDFTWFINHLKRVVETCIVIIYLFCQSLFRRLSYCWNSKYVTDFSVFFIIIIYSNWFSLQRRGISSSIIVKFETYSNSKEQNTWKYFRMNVVLIPLNLKKALCLTV